MSVQQSSEVSYSRSGKHHVTQLPFLAAHSQHIVPAWWTSTIIRDYAFPPSDPRFHGNSLTKEEDPNRTSKSKVPFSDDEQSDDHADGGTEHLFESDEDDDAGVTSSVEDDESDEEDDDDGISWAWQWTYKQRLGTVKPLAPPDGFEDTSTSVTPSEPAPDTSETTPSGSLPLVKFKDFDTIVISKLRKLISQELQSSPDVTVEDKLRNVKLYRAKTVFPFVKATEYEMSLETGDEVVIISLESDSKKDVDSVAPKPASNPTDTSSKGKSEPAGRWISIDELDDIDDTRVSLKDSAQSLNLSDSNTITDNLNIELDPPMDRFVLEVVQFLGFNKTYGSSWMTALKLKAKGTAFGSSSQALVRLKLRDLGLVPGNYVEPQ